MKIIYKIFTFVFLTAMFLMWGSFCFAGCTSQDDAESYNNYEQYACEAAGYKWTSNSTSGTVTLTNPIGTTDLPTLLGKVINSIMGVIGSLALVMFIYGGIIWMLSAGNQEQVTKGKNILIWAAVGIVIIFSSYALVKLVLTAMVS